MPWYLHRTYGDDGRLVIREVIDESGGYYFRARRSNGRLTLHLVHLVRSPPPPPSPDEERAVDDPGLDAAAVAGDPPAGIGGGGEGDADADGGIDGEEKRERPWRRGKKEGEAVLVVIRGCGDGVLVVVMAYCGELLLETDLGDSGSTTLVNISGRLWCLCSSRSSVSKEGKEGRKEKKKIKFLEAENSYINCACGGPRRWRPEEGSKGSITTSHMIEGGERNPEVLMLVAKDE
ncbi:hypothetical protein QJS10_CPA09g00491 [Acorus calamus]|uniref:FAF domain-containing protein n=1 Tax=Acorus calamus TaxID=4465 RepID=A0AAV9E829_ACOCL|nr:hypothetical protein QJS10_CPA09g00491 [Acorus calamus]